MGQTFCQYTGTLLSAAKETVVAKASSNKKKTEPALRAPKRKSIEDVRISPEIRLRLYSLRRAFPDEFEQKAGLQIPFVTYFQDPFVAKQDPKNGLNEKAFVDWEPGLADGPTSSRFAVVDYNADSGRLEPAAVWDLETERYLGTNQQPVESGDPTSFQFHQVSVWALLKCALDFFEEPTALGRTIPWAFEGNRLIVVPHAGYGENAYYDRLSKSLQFYYFGTDPDIVYTCLSSDIVHHEFGHAVLDGIRPLFNESSHPQTGAFHEFMGDLTAILLTLKNKTLRKELAKASDGKFAEATTLSSLAEEFGQAVKGRPYLRTARNTDTMSRLANETSPHLLSGVLTGAMFDALMALGEKYEERSDEDASETKETPSQPKKTQSPMQTFYRASDRFNRTAIQPLDLLPPADVTFKDYAFAVCRSQQLSDPLDPEHYYDMLIKVFRDREILTAEDEKLLKEPRYLTDRLSLSVRHSMDDISRSRASAYQYLDDNREELLIPAGRDFFVADLYDAKKWGRQNLPLPRQIVLQYAWREELPLDGVRFGRFAGRLTTMLCGGTLVFREDGNVLSWMRKPGSEPFGGKWSHEGQLAERWLDAQKEGSERRTFLLDTLAAQIAAGRVGSLLGSSQGVVGGLMPPMTADEDGAFVRFQWSPHLHLSEDAHITSEEETGARQWEISC
jgi:hypothetical protein